MDRWISAFVLSLALAGCASQTSEREPSWHLRLPPRHPARGGCSGTGDVRGTSADLSRPNGRYLLVYPDSKGHVRRCMAVLNTHFHPRSGKALFDVDASLSENCPAAHVWVGRDLMNKGRGAIAVDLGDTHEIFECHI
jgi:hypothetical protein